MTLLNQFYRWLSKIFLPCYNAVKKVTLLLSLVTLFSMCHPSVPFMSKWNSSLWLTSSGCAFYHKKPCIIHRNLPLKGFSGMWVWIIYYDRFLRNVFPNNAPMRVIYDRLRYCSLCSGHLTMSDELLINNIFPLYKTDIKYTYCRINIHFLFLYCNLCVVKDWWFSYSTQESEINKTGCHDITELLLKVVSLKAHYLIFTRKYLPFGVQL